MRLCKVGAITLLSVLTTLPLTTYANLRITNYTGQSYSLEFNGQCSINTWGTFGVIPAKSIIDVPQSLADDVCSFNPNYCVAMLYASADCSGNPFASLTLSSESGFVGVKMFGSEDKVGYTINLKGFDMIIDYTH